MKLRNMTASVGSGLALAIFASGAASAATMLPATNLSDLKLGAFVNGPVGPRVDSGFNASGANYGDFSGGAACPEGFTTCVPSDNAAGTVYTYVQTVTIGQDTIPNDVVPAGAPLPSDAFANASAPQDPGSIDFYALEFLPAGFNGVAGYDFGQAAAAGVSFDIAQTADGLTWSADGDWAIGETLSFFFQSTQAPVGPAGFYSIGNADLTATARGPLPTPELTPVPLPAGGLLLLTSLLGFRALRKKS